MFVLIFPISNPWYVRRSSRPEVFCKKMFTGKHLCQSLFFNNVAGLRHRCFPVNFAKFLRAPFPTEHLQWLLLFMSGLKYDYKIICGKSNPFFFHEKVVCLTLTWRYDFLLDKIPKAMKLNYVSHFKAKLEGFCKEYSG